MLAEALARHGAGEIDAAIVVYKKILAEEPEHPEALHMMGVIAQQRGNSALALKLLDVSLAKKPDNALAWSNRAITLRTLGQAEAALLSAQEAVRLDPALARGWDTIGWLLREFKRLDEAADAHARAVQLIPDHAPFQNNYAILLMAQGKVEAALRVAETAERLDPLVAATTLGHLWKAKGQPERAASFFAKARQGTNPADAAVNEALARLQMGDMETGLALWEERLDINPLFAGIPRWQGGKTAHLLVYEPQGLGDAIQCLRFVPALRVYAERITFQLAAPLQRLVQDCFPDCTFLTLSDPVPAATARVALMSLPYILKARLDTLPATPYLKAREDERAIWRQRLAAMPSRRFGLVWEGNRDNPVNPHRSVPLEALQPLFGRWGAHLVSLQKGPAEADLPAGLFNAAPFLPDLAATAALIAELDGVITMCSAPAHLTGALGQKGFVLLSYDPHWIWLRDGGISPWYPSLRLLRQPASGDWQSVIKELLDVLPRGGTV